MGSYVVHMVVPDKLCAQNVVNRLVALSWPVAPIGKDLELWRIGDTTFTGSELLEFAVWAGVVSLDSEGRCAEIGSFANG